MRFKPPTVIHEESINFKVNNKRVIVNLEVYSDYDYSYSTTCLDPLVSLTQEEQAELLIQIKEYYQKILDEKILNANID